jgi:hypothetical protein
MATDQQNAEKGYDTLEGTTLEIEAIKDELASITMTRTGIGAWSRDRWDTPEVKTGSGKKGRLRKDRYSALLMAHMMARQLIKGDQKWVYEFGTDHGQMSQNTGKLYQGPEWFTKSMGDFLGVVQKGGDDEGNSVMSMFGD